MTQIVADFFGLRDARRGSSRIKFGPVDADFRGFPADHTDADRRKSPDAPTGRPKLPERNGQPITLIDVATHTSGLPLMPDDLPSHLNDELAKAKYSAAQLYQFLARYELPQQSGAKWDYSNIGYSLLGQALAARAGMDYETLLRTRVIAALELKGTGITVVPELIAELAVGHDGSLQPAPPISTAPMMAVILS